MPETAARSTSTPYTRAPRSSGSWTNAARKHAPAAITATRCRIQSGQGSSPSPYCTKSAYASRAPQVTAPIRFPVRRVSQAGSIGRLSLGPCGATRCRSAAPAPEILSRTSHRKGRPAGGRCRNSAGAAKVRTLPCVSPRSAPVYRSPGTGSRTVVCRPVKTCSSGRTAGGRSRVPCRSPGRACS